jgi:glycosyltransferase involved in cell wall biosynthesis
LRIAQISQYFYPFMTGGAEWYVLNISRELSKRGHDVDVITLNRGRNELPEEEKFENITIKRLPASLDMSYRLKVWKGLSEALKHGKYDIIHTYDYACYHSKEAVSFSLKEGIPCVVTVFDAHGMINRGRIKKIGMRVIEKYYRGLLLKCDAVLVRAPQLIPYLEKIGVESSKMHLTPSGIRDECLDSYDGSSFRKKHALEGKRIVLYVGRLSSMKGLEILLDVAREISIQRNDVVFVIVGDDTTDYASRLKAMVDSNGLREKVVFTGKIENFNEKMEAYSSCDVFVMPSSYEGTSQAIFEAMSQSKAVVAFRVGGIPFQIKDSYSGFLVDYPDREMMKKRIIQLLDDIELSKQIGENARRSVECFRYSILAEKVLDIYSLVLRNKNGNE